MVIKNVCGTCQGQGVHSSRVNEDIQIPKGVNTGQNIRMTQKVPS